MHSQTVSGKEDSPHNSKAPKQSIYSTNVNYIDIKKMEKLVTLMNNLYKSKKVFKAFLSVLFDLKNCVNCSVVTLFLFDSKISDH